MLPSWFNTPLLISQGWARTSLTRSSLSIVHPRALRSSRCLSTRSSCWESTGISCCILVWKLPRSWLRYLIQIRDLWMQSRSHSLRNQKLLPHLQRFLEIENMQWCQPEQDIWLCYRSWCASCICWWVISLLQCQNWSVPLGLLKLGGWERLHLGLFELMNWRWQDISRTSHGCLVGWHNNRERSEPSNAWMVERDWTFLPCSLFLQ